MKLTVGLIMFQANLQNMSIYTLTLQSMDNYSTLYLIYMQV